MACGKPVITTNLPSIAELIENGKNGFIVKENDPKQTAGAIEFLYGDEVLRNELGEAGRKVVLEKFDIKKNAKELKSIFDKAIEKRRCTACGSYDTQVLIEGRASRDANVLKCKGCNVIFLEGTASKEVYSILSSAYWRDRGDQKKIYTDEAVSEGIGGEFLRRMSKIDSLMPNKGSILDVGCGIGQFLRIAKNDGWECQGLDVSAEAVNYVKEFLGIDAVCKDLKANGFSRNQFDAVTMWDVIEHLQDPVGDIKIISSILKKDGILAIKTPNEAGLFKAIGKLIYRASFGKINFHLKYLYYSPHYHYFYPRTISKILEDNGFKILDIEFDDTNLEFARKKLEKHYGKYPSSRIFSMSLKPLCLLAAMLKRQNKMIVYARKVKVGA
jgi:2-polyprenyl-3-methyl-5-hydroxy-6-metoxy-1,4-benzoquinol methylase